MNKQEKALIIRIYKDCLRLKKQGELTEFGEGQIALCKILLKHGEKQNDKKSNEINRRNNWKDAM